jgi:hypothetical protein
LLISVHIPKTAGTSFGELLQARFGTRFRTDYGDRPLAPNHAWRRIVGRWQRDREVEASVDCIHGHFVADKYDFLGASSRHVTWLRDPLQRVASHYRYWLRTPDLRNPDCRRLVEERLSLEDFAALPRMRDVCARFFGDKQPRDFFFIGLTEDMPGSLARFWRLTGIDAQDMPTSNRSEESPQDDDLPPATRRRLADLNQRDVALYEATVALLRTGRG